MANITLLNAYTPIEEARNEEKDEFYKELTNTCEGILKHDTLMLVGDFNAKSRK